MANFKNVLVSHSISKRVKHLNNPENKLDSNSFEPKIRNRSIIPLEFTEKRSTSIPVDEDMLIRKIRTKGECRLDWLYNRAVVKLMISRRKGPFAAEDI